MAGLGGLGRAIGTIIDIRKEKKYEQAINTLLAEAADKMNRDPTFSVGDFMLRAARRGLTKDPRVKEYAQVIGQAQQQRRKTITGQQQQQAIGDLAERSMTAGPIAQEQTVGAPGYQQSAAGESPPSMTLYGEPESARRPEPKTREEYLRQFALGASELPPGITQEQVAQNPQYAAALGSYPPMKEQRYREKFAFSKEKHEDLMEYREKQLLNQQAKWQAKSTQTADKTQRKNQDSNIKWIIKQQNEAKKDEDKAREKLAETMAKAANPADLGDYSEAIDLYKKLVDRYSKEVDAWGAVGDIASQSGGAAMTQRDIQAAFRRAIGSGFGAESPPQTGAPTGGMSGGTTRDPAGLGL